MAAPLHAQSSIRVSGGTAIPLSPELFTDAAAPGASVEIGPTAALTNQLDLAVMIGHNRLPMDGTPTFGAGAMTSWSVSARLLVYMLPATSMIRPYAVVGSGAHWLNHLPERIEISCPPLANCPPSYITGRDDPEGRFDIQGGLGTSVRLTPKLEIFAESTSTSLFSGNSDLQYVPVRLGVHYRPTPQMEKP